MNILDEVLISNNNLIYPYLYYRYDTNIDDEWILVQYSKDNDMLEGDIVEGDIELYLNPTDIDPFIVLYILLYRPSVFHYIIHYKIINNQIELTSTRHEISFKIIGEIKHGISLNNVYPISIIGDITYNQSLYLLSLISSRYVT